MKLDLFILLYFYALINLCLCCLANCVVTNALHTLCTSMYHYDCCKDLMEGEINQSMYPGKSQYNYFPVSKILHFCSSPMKLSI